MTQQPQAAKLQNPPPPIPCFRPFRPWLRPLIAILLISLVYFYRLDRPLLWDDEAETGVVARNTLRSGYPTASDGRNATLYDNGAELNEYLVFKKIPWTQYYLGAFSLLVFGNTTAGLRILFAFCGVLSFLPIYAILRTRLKYPAFLTTLAMLSPQIVLFQRSARYYPMLILLYAILVWHLLGKFKSSMIHFISASLIFVLLFHTHPLAAMCSGLSLIGFCLFSRRRDLVSYFFAFAAGFASWLIWYRLLGPSLAEADFAFSLINTNFGIWFKMFCTGLLATIIDMDVVGCLPLLLWAVLLAVVFARRRTVRGVFRDPLYAFVFLNIFVQAVACAALFGFESASRYSMLRYQPHLLVFGLIAAFMALQTVVAGKCACLLVSLFAVAFNLLAFSFWAKPFARRVPFSWALPVYAEIFNPRETVWDLALSRLASESQNAPDPGTVLLAQPPWTREIAIFYLGGQYLIRPILHPPSAPCEQALRRNMGAQALAGLMGQPGWILSFPGSSKSVPAGYDLAGTFPSHQTEPVDGSRPELTHHSFAQSAAVSEARLFHLQKNPARP